MGPRPGRLTQWQYSSAMTGAYVASARWTLVRLTPTSLVVLRILSPLRTASRLPCSSAETVSLVFPAARPAQPSFDLILGHCAFELGKCAQHPKHGRPVNRGRDRPRRPKFAQPCHQVRPESGRMSSASTTPCGGHFLAASLRLRRRLFLQMDCRCEGWRRQRSEFRWLARPRLFEGFNNAHQGR